MNKKIVAIVFVAILLSVAFVVDYIFKEPERDHSWQKPDFVMTMDSLAAQYDADDEAAYSKFSGKLLRLSGTLSEHRYSEHGVWYFIFDTAPDIQVVCILPRDGVEKGEYKNGDQLVIQGKNDGMLMEIMMRECNFVKE